MRRAALERHKVEPPGDVAEEVDREIWTVVQQLPQRQRVAALLWCLLDLPEQEVAAMVSRGEQSLQRSRPPADNLARWLTEEGSRLPELRQALSVLVEHPPATPTRRELRTVKPAAFTHGRGAHSHSDAATRRYPTPGSVTSLVRVGLSPSFFRSWLA